MSEPAVNSREESEVSDSRAFMSALGWIGAIFIFVLICFIAYLPNRAAPIDEEIIAERYATYAEVTAKQEAAASEYAWVDQPNGVVRIPLERAKVVAVKKLSAAQK